MQTKRGVALSDCRVRASPDAFHSTPKIRKREVVPVNQGFLCRANLCAAARRRPNCTAAISARPCERGVLIFVQKSKLETAMLIYVEDKSEIKRAQNRLERTLRKHFSTKSKKDIGYPGGRVRQAEVFTDGRYWFRSADLIARQAAHPRRLNWFGRYSDRPGTGIIVEINVAYEGRDAQAAGFFARDSETGITYLMHSGRVGGGTNGVGKTSFRTFSREPPIKVLDSRGNSRDGLVVMPIQGNAANRSGLRYVGIVENFKRAVRNGEIQTPEFQRKQKQYEDFYSEGRGRRRGKRSSKIDYLSRHGEIVDTLFKWRQLSPLPLKGRLVKDQLIDLGVAVGPNLREVFEVKTNTTRQTFYTALGQLMVHGRSIRCRKVMALPHDEDLPDDLAKAIRLLGIELIRFKLSDRGITIK
jgi:hypothetical protein